MGARRFSSLPQAVAERVARASARNRAVVVVPKDGRASRVFTLQNYLKMRELPGKTKPWKSRRKKSDIPDPLGAVPGGKVIGSLRRQEIYD